MWGCTHDNGCPYNRHCPLISASQHCRGRSDKHTPDFLPALLRRVLLYGFIRKYDVSCCCRPAHMPSSSLLALPYAKNKHVIGVRVLTACLPRGSKLSRTFSRCASIICLLRVPRGGFDHSARRTHDITPRHPQRYHNDGTCVCVIVTLGGVQPAQIFPD